MQVFFALVGISVVGVLLVFFLVQREERSAGVPLRGLGSSPAFPPPPPVPNPDVPKKSGFLGIFGKKNKQKASIVSMEEVSKPPVPKNFFVRLIPRKKVSLERERREEVPLPALKDFLDEQNRQKSVAVPVATPTEKLSAQQAQLPPEEEKRIEQEIDLTARLEEWKEKYERLDKLFQEKSAAFEKNEELLQAELNNRKEFNKLKDILEKELKEAKDKARIAQVELAAAKAESESYKKRISQLEEKVTKSEKALLAKDDELADLVKRLEAKPLSVVDAPPVPPVAQTVLAPEAKVADPIPPQPSEDKVAGEADPGPLKLKPDILASPENPPAAPVESKTEEPKIPDTAAPPVPEKSDPLTTNPDDQKGVTDG